MAQARRSQRRLGEVGEHGFLASLLALHPSASTDVLVGPGDDCAVVAAGKRALLVTIDALVEGAHFQPGWLTPVQLGAKSFSLNASDIAAMGGRPRWAVVQLSAPPRCSVRDLSAIQRGIVRAAAAAGAAVVGGNLTRDSKLSIAICLIGETSRHVVRRNGARAGDRILVTGTVGDSALGLRQIQGGGRRDRFLVSRFVAPTARLRAGWLLGQRGIASSMIDVSDGLLQDLGHLCEASRVGARVVSQFLPRSAAYRRVSPRDLSLALTGGEDYELLFTVSPRKRAAFERVRAQLGCPVTEIGEITAAREILVDGAPAAVAGGGFDHFRGAADLPRNRRHRRSGRTVAGSAKADA